MRSKHTFFFFYIYNLSHKWYGTDLTINELTTYVTKLHQKRLQESLKKEKKGRRKALVCSRKNKHPYRLTAKKNDNFNGTLQKLNVCKLFVVLSPFSKRRNNSSLMTNENITLIRSLRTPADSLVSDDFFFFPRRLSAAGYFTCSGN